jgi:hypothetical protein
MCLIALSNCTQFAVRRLAGLFAARRCPAICPHRLLIFGGVWFAPSSLPPVHLKSASASVYISVCACDDDRNDSKIRRIEMEEQINNNFFILFF